LNRSVAYTLLVRLIRYLSSSLDVPQCHYSPQT